MSASEFSDKKRPPRAEADYLSTLERLSREGRIPMHMPGHKRRTLFAPALPFSLDFTEIDGTWDLHHPDDALNARLAHWAKQRGAGRTFFCTNGSTAGILAAMHALTRRGDAVLLSRASHQSVHHAVELFGLTPIYLTPPLLPPDLPGPIPLSLIRSALEAHPQTKVLVLTSPTYEGVGSDLEAILRYCHAHRVHVLVDQAHGAHLPYLKDSLPSLPGDAVAAGCDVVVESLHKMLPVLTPGALVHVQDASLEEGVARGLRMFETSSPSHLILASMDRGLAWMEDEGRAYLRHLAAALEQARVALCGPEGLKHLTLFPKQEPPAANSCTLEKYGANASPEKKKQDPFKWTVCTHRCSVDGPELTALLREEGVEPEMTGMESVLLYFAAGDPIERPEQMAALLKKLDQRLESRDTSSAASLPFPVPSMQQPVCPPWEARELEVEAIFLDDAAGRVAGEMLWQYPPGIPLLLPGERISPDILPQWKARQKRGIRLQSEHPSMMEEERPRLFVLRREG